MSPHSNPETSALLLVDYQVGTMQLIKNLSLDLVLRNAIVLAKTARAYKMPIIVTSSQKGHIQGVIAETLAPVVPAAFKARIQRMGLVNVWKDANFKKAVVDTGQLSGWMNRTMTTIRHPLHLRFSRLDCAAGLAAVAAIRPLVPAGFKQCT